MGLLILVSFFGLTFYTNGLSGQDQSTTLYNTFTSTYNQLSAIQSQGIEQSIALVYIAIIASILLIIAGFVGIFPLGTRRPRGGWNGTHHNRSVSRNSGSDLQPSGLWNCILSHLARVYNFTRRILLAQKEWWWREGQRRSASECLLSRGRNTAHRRWR